MRFRPGESLDADALALALGRRRGRRLDKATITRALWRMAQADPALQDRLLDELGTD